MTYYTIVKNHACSDLEMGFYRPPAKNEYLNYQDRIEEISAIMIHYTVADFARSYYLLAHDNGGRPGPSVHYMINADGRIDNLVDDSYVAWHAGASLWKDKKFWNQKTIGIELVNPGSGDENCFPLHKNYTIDSQVNCSVNAFSTPQIASLKALTTCLKVQHPTIKHTLAHSDVAPDRKLDPGIAAKEVWQELAKDNIGIYSEKTINSSEIIFTFGDSGEQVLKLKADLHNFGYGYLNLSSNSYDLITTQVVRAFHLHYNPDLEPNQYWGDWSTTDQARLEDLQ